MKFTKTRKSRHKGYFRNFIFGVEDSLVSTLGVITGIAIVGVPRSTILLTGVILIFVEAYSMAIGSLLSENAAREFEKKREIPVWYSYRDAAVMWVSYIFSGFIVLSPYLVTDSDYAMYYSVFLGLITLFVVGLIIALVAKISIIKKGLTMILIGGSAIVIGIFVGNLVNFI